MDDNNLFKWKDARVYLITIGCLIAIVAYYQPILAFVGAIGLAYLVYHYRKTINNKKKRMD